MKHYYTNSQFENFCKTAFGDFENAGADNIQVMCPFCKRHKGGKYHKRKLAIHLQTHALHCWVCDYSSKNLYHVLDKFFPSYLNEYIEIFGENISITPSEERNTVVQLPKDFVLLAMPGNRLTEEQEHKIYTAKKYLKKRGIQSEHELWYWKFGISLEGKFKNRIIVPSFNEQGTLNYYTARAVFENIAPKYENPSCLREAIIFNEININWEKELFLVEGVFDLFKCGTNTVPLLGKNLTGDSVLFEKIVINKTPVTVALDPDAKRNILAIGQRLMEFDIDVRILDLTDSGYKDIGEMSKEKFISVSEHAKVLNRETYLRERISGLLL